MKTGTTSDAAALTDSPHADPPLADPPRAARRPPLWVAAAGCAALLLLVGGLRLGALPHVILPIAYGVPLVLASWFRRRRLLWALAAAFAVVSFVKFYYVYPAAAPDRDQISPGFRALSVAMIIGDLLVITWVLHGWVAVRGRLESQNEAAGAVNRDLAAGEQEIARQNEELGSQAKELERRAEALRVANEELSRRGQTMEQLLGLSRSLTTDLSRGQTLDRICRSLTQLVGGGASASAILEQEGDRLAVCCSYGFGPEGLAEQAVPLDQSFAALVMSRARTAFLEDVRLRPELRLPQPKSGPPVRSVLAAPLRVGGWPVGTLEVYSRHAGPWADEQVALLESLAAQASVSLEAAELFGRVEGERERLKTVLQTLPVGMLIAEDPEGTRMSANAALASLYRVPDDRNFAPDGPGVAAEVRRTFRREGRPLAPEDLPLVRALRTGRPVRGEEFQVTLDDHDGGKGHTLTVLMSAAPFVDASGRVSGGVGVLMDITAQKQLQRELDTRRREAEEASVRKTRFLAAVSHDIRTPANAISLLAELIRRTASNPAMASEVPELARELHGSAMSLVHLLGDVLDVARFDSGRIELRESEFSVGDLLAEEHRRMQPLAREKGLEMQWAPPPRPLRVRADRIKLSRVIGNLVGNAIKFTDAGAVRLEGGRTAAGEACVRVSDTGHGIAPEHLQHIFDEFFQLRNPERDRNKGTGLGLTICKRLVDAMGGRLEVQSKVGEGSTFTVTLPARVPTPAPDAAQSGGGE